MKFAKVSSPLDGHEILRTTCPSKALETMASFGAQTIRPAAHGAFCFKVDAISMKDVVLAHGYHGGGTRTTYDTADFFWQAFAINGTCTQKSGRSETRLDSRNWSALYSPHRLVASHAGAGYQQLTAKIRAAAARRLLSSLTGQEIGDLTIDRHASTSSPRLQSMRRNVFSLAWELDAVVDKSFPAVLREMEQAIILSLVLGHHHNYSKFLLTEPKAPSLAQLAMVEEYIIANCDQPLEVTALAEVCDVSARSIFRYFRERRGCSPSQFLKSVRLQRARSNLLAADIGTSVVATALKAGFTSLGHFARNYRAAYGENPSETLSRALKISASQARDPSALPSGTSRKRGW